MSTDAKAAASADYTLTKIVEVLGVIDDVIIDDADFGFLLFVQAHLHNVQSIWGAGLHVP